MKQTLLNQNKTTFRQLFQNGGVAGKLSFFIMGSSNFFHKQFVKGFVFILLQLGFLYWFVKTGIQTIAHLQKLATKQTEQVLDPITGIGKNIQGDNAMLFLLFGIASLIMVLLFLFFYFLSLKSARINFEQASKGKPVSTFRQDLKSLINERFHITLMSIPLLGVLFFTVLPLIYMISIAFTNYDAKHQDGFFHWVGLANFGNVITGDMASSFFPILGWTFIWAILATFSNFFLGILLALVINTKGIRLKKMWRTIFILTMAIPAFISLLIMRKLFDNDGIINITLQNLGFIKGSIPFLQDPNWAKFTVLFVNLWIGIPATMLVSTSIIQNLPSDQLEAARIDGANRWQTFRAITFPQILFVMTPALIQQFVGNINNFNVIFLLTGGGPSNSDFYQAGSTDLLVTWLYKLTLNSGDFNLASVIGILIFLLSATFSLIAYTRTNSFQNEGG